MFSLPCRLVKGEEEDKCKIVLAAIEAKLPYLHRLVCEPMGTYTYMYIDLISYVAIVTDCHLTPLGLSGSVWFSFTSSNLSEKAYYLSEKLPRGPMMYNLIVFKFKCW